MHRITERPPEPVIDIVREGCAALGCDVPAAGIPMELLQPLIWTLAHELDSVRQERDAARSGLESLRLTIERGADLVRSVESAHHPDRAINVEIHADILEGHVATLRAALSQVLTLAVATPNGLRVKDVARQALLATDLANPANLVAGGGS